MTARRKSSKRPPRNTRRSSVWTRASLMKLAPAIPREEDRSAVLKKIERNLTRPDTPAWGRRASTPRRH